MRFLPRITRTFAEVDVNGGGPNFPFTVPTGGDVTRTTKDGLEVRAMDVRARADRPAAVHLWVDGHYATSATNTRRRWQLGILRLQGKGRSINISGTLTHDETR